MIRFVSGKGWFILEYFVERNLAICLQGLCLVTFWTFISFGENNLISLASWIFLKPAGIGMKNKEMDEEPYLR